MNSVKKYCNKAILIKDGEIIVNGNKDDVADRYTVENFTPLNAKEGAHDKDAYPVGLNERVPQLRIIPRSPLLISNTENFKFDIEYEFNEDERFLSGYCVA